jgi:hypothetical protein
MSINANCRNDSVVNKLKSVLDNTDYIDYATITIKIARGEVSEIRYNINEFITPDNAEGEQNA